MNSINIYLTFVGGLVSFLSPCVLPIMPGFLAYLAGSIDGKEKQKIFLHTIFFVLGFTVVFSVVGVLLNTVLAPFANNAKDILGMIGGGIIVFFGLMLARVINIDFLNRDHKLKVKTNKKPKLLTSFLFGSAFAAGWSPCVGAVLGAVLTLAATNPASSLLLLISYSLGLGLPFILIGLFAEKAQEYINKYSKYLEYINIGFGFFLVFLGVLIFTGNLNLIASFSFINNFVN